MVIAIRKLNNLEAQIRSHGLARRAVLRRSVGAVLLLFAASRLRRFYLSLLLRIYPLRLCLRSPDGPEWIESIVGAESGEELINGVVGGG